MHRVTITAGARLHFGPLACAATVGRRFGGVGAMIDAPRTVVTLRIAETDAIDAPASVAERVARFVAEYRRRSPADRVPPPCAIEVSASIPEHAGLGSGTQLGLAVAQALALAANDGAATPETLAARIGRGARSAIGLHGFHRGGLLVDGGHAIGQEIGTLVARTEFPAEWRFALVTPRDVRGLSGRAEREAFAQLPPMSDALTDRLCRLVLLGLLPAATDADFEACGEAFYDFGRLVGEYFAPVQGGTYAEPRLARLVERLRRAGRRGIGQSSWGPTLFVLCRDEGDAARLLDELRADPELGDGMLRIAAPMNHGAIVGG